jgi:CRP-like cAMP-binding protein
MSIQLDYLKNIPYFSGVSLVELESISKIIFEKTANRGEIVLFEGEPAVLLYGIKKNEMEAIVQNHPQIAMNVIKVLVKRVRHLLSLVEDLSFKHVIGRVAKILVEHIGGEISRGRRLTQQEMAAMAGTAREVVGRSLKALEEQGAIELDRHRIVITDKEALQKLMEVSS